VSSGLDETAVLVGRSVSSFVLLFLPAIAAAAFVLKRGCRNLVLTGLVALAATGIYGYAVFWLWFLPRLGRLTALLIPALSLLALVYLVARLDRPARRILRTLVPPILLCGTFSVFVLSVGFLYGGMAQPFETAANRFSHPLPTDNQLPWRFAEGLWQNHIPKPLYGDWSSSDRPPLQAGLSLAQERFYSRDRQLTALITGVVAQSTCMLALWLFLLAADIEPAAVMVVLVACLSSGFVLVNTFFTWPKLLAAAYTIGALAVLFNRKAAEVAKSNWASALCGTLVALALLSHGGAAFAFIGAALTLCALRVRLPVRGIAVLLATALLVYLPWTLYQKCYDPPGDRLLKLHLAGIYKVDSRPLGEALVTAYQAKTVKEIYENKRSNWITAVDGNRVFWTNVWDWVRSMFAGDSTQELKLAYQLRGDEFFFLLPTLNFLVLGLPALLLAIFKRYRTVTWFLAARLFFFGLITVIPWCLLMFGPATTVVHQGAYATVLLAFAACCLSLWSVSPWLAGAAIVLQALSTFVLYGPFMREMMPNQQLVPYGELRSSMLLAALIALAAVIWLLYRMAKQGHPESFSYCRADVPSAELLGQNTVH
jgi:hypothetical protein